MTIDKVLNIKERLLSLNPSILLLYGAPEANYHIVRSRSRWFVTKFVGLLAFVAGAVWGSEVPVLNALDSTMQKGLICALLAAVMVWLVMPTVKSGYQARQKALHKAKEHIIAVNGQDGLIHQLSAFRSLRGDLQNQEYDRLISLSFENRWHDMRVADLESLARFREDYLDILNVKLIELSTFNQEL